MVEAYKLLKEDPSAYSNEEEGDKIWSFRELLSWKIPEHLVSNNSSSKKQLKRVMEGVNPEYIN